MLSGYTFATIRYLSTIGKKVLNSNISTTCSYNMVNFGPLTGDRLLSLGHPAKFIGLRVFASLLHRGRSTEVNQTLHDVSPCPGLVDYTYTFGGSPNGILPGATAKFTLRPILVFSYIGSVTARHSSSGRQPNFVVWHKEWNLFRNFSSSSVLTEGATYIPRAAITLGIEPHSSL